MEGEYKKTGEGLREKEKRGEEEEHNNEGNKRGEGRDENRSRVLKKLGGEVDVEEIRKLEGEKESMVVEVKE